MVMLFIAIKNNTIFSAIYQMVAGTGLEPVWETQAILSRSRIPIPPPGLIKIWRCRSALAVKAPNKKMQARLRFSWRCRPELNRCTRFCRPLRNHSATAPCLNIISYFSWTKKNASGENAFFVCLSFGISRWTGSTPPPEIRTPLNV